MAQGNGHILVESGPDQGTTFEILFPRLEPSSIAAPSEVKVAAEVPRGTETILLVEDNQALRDLLKESLEEGGYRVFTATDGEAALAVARSAARPINLLLTDVVMPRMSGPELAATLVRSDPELRVVFMSGYAGGEHTGAILRDDRFVRVEKPFDNAHLARVIRAELDRSKAP